VEINMGRPCLGHYPIRVNAGSVQHLRGRDLLLDTVIEGKIILKLMLNRKRGCVPKLTGWVGGGVKLNAFVRTVKELSVNKLYVYLNR
jgi:hypothetical protein